MEITITKSTISGLHMTKKGSHPSIALKVLPDPTRHVYDRNCMQVVCPALGNIHLDLHNEIVWPRNIKSKRFTDVLVKDVAGSKIGHVPANLCFLFKRLIDSKEVASISCFATGEKPRNNNLVPHNQSFEKGRSGTKDRRGGGVVLDCKYVLHLAAGRRSAVVREVENFMETNEGNEAFH